MLLVWFCGTSNIYWIFLELIAVRMLRGSLRFDETIHFPVYRIAVKGIYNLRSAEIPPE
ncbi:hypothetical protein C7S15_1876 [Burkholderia cepacia]|nr:hypothetical protein [Burkholderia cepacia]